jgi:hypothetical protein
MCNGDLVDAESFGPGKTPSMLLFQASSVVIVKIDCPKRIDQLLFSVNLIKDTGEINE